MYRRLHHPHKIVVAQHGYVILTRNVWSQYELALCEQSTLTVIRTMSDDRVERLHSRSDLIARGEVEVHHTKVIVTVHFSNSCCPARFKFPVSNDDGLPIQWCNRAHEQLCPTRVFITNDILYCVPTRLCDFLSMTHTRLYHMLGQYVLALRHCNMLPELITHTLTMLVIDYTNTDYRAYCRSSQHPSWL